MPGTEATTAALDHVVGEGVTTAADAGVAATAAVADDVSRTSTAVDDGAAAAKTVVEDDDNVTTTAADGDAVSNRRSRFKWRQEEDDLADVVVSARRFRCRR